MSPNRRSRGHTSPYLPHISPYLPISPRPDGSVTLQMPSHTPAFQPALEGTRAPPYSRRIQSRGAISEHLGAISTNLGANLGGQSRRISQPALETTRAPPYSAVFAPSIWRFTAFASRTQPLSRVRAVFRRMPLRSHPSYSRGARDTHCTPHHPLALKEAHSGLDRHNAGSLSPSPPPRLPARPSTCPPRRRCPPPPPPPPPGPRRK